MTEDFLHYLWKYRLIAPYQQLINGEFLEVLNPGVHNKHAGPDFLNARIRIGMVTWAGNVEFHLRSSDWQKHGHHHDRAYDNVILHVVFKNDRDVKVRGGKPIPTLVLEDRIDIELFGTYQQLMLNRNWIPCSHQISLVSPIVLYNWLDRMIIERYDRKAMEINSRMGQTKNDWSEVFYQTLAANFGFRVNAIPFELLAKAVPLMLVNKHRKNLFQLEALYFGQAGFLKNYSRNSYYYALRKEYKFLAAKYGLQPMNVHLWKFMRMRPANFPTIRIAQFADLMAGVDFLFSKVVQASSLTDLKYLMEARASEFWESHYTFTRRTSKKSKVLGQSASHLILINTVVPFLYAYGKIKSKEQFCHKALEFLEAIPGEKNSIIRKWTELGISVNRAIDTQALLELKSSYCDRKKCLHCVVGLSILKSYRG